MLLLKKEGGIMASRMDRYNYSSDTAKRTSKNSSLYDDIYESREYGKLSDVKDINVDTLSVTTSHQVDIEEVKALLEKRDSYQKNRRIVKEQPTITKESKVYEEEIKNYDLNDMISKAREGKKEEYRPRSLADTQVLTLKEIVTQKDYSNKSKLDDDEVKDLVDTIYRNNLLEDGGLLDDLKSSGNTIADPNIKEILKEKKEEMEKSNDEVEGIDKTFFTSSLGFKKSDFEEMSDDFDDSSKGSKIATFFLIISCLIFVGLIVYVIINYVIK